MKYVLMIPAVWLIAGCTIFGPPQPSAASYGVKASWLGAPVAEFAAAMGQAGQYQALPDGRGEYRWLKDRSLKGPPRTEFGPGGKIKTRPGTVTYNYCRAVAMVDSKDRIESLEFEGDCPASLLPPTRR